LSKKGHLAPKTLGNAFLVPQTQGQVSAYE